MTDTSAKKAPSYSISKVSGSEGTNDYVVTITQDGKSVGEVIIRATSTAEEVATSSTSKK